MLYRIARAVMLAHGYFECRREQRHPYFAADGTRLGAGDNNAWRVQ